MGKVWTFMDEQRRRQGEAARAAAAAAPIVPAPAVTVESRKPAAVNGMSPGVAKFAAEMRMPGQAVPAFAWEQVTPEQVEAFRAQQRAREALRRAGGLPEGLRAAAAEIAGQLQSNGND